MENQKKLIFLSVFLLLGCLIQSSSYEHQKSLSKLFVFGDSYADTGNTDRSSKSWSMPYGITFPGKPSGRSSDGRVFTDYLASHLNIKSPLPYRFRKVGKDALRHGINFAYGGTGVFDAFAPYPNMTTQIDFLQKLIEDGVYTEGDLSSSVAHISLSGNDYITYYRIRNGTRKGIPSFTRTVVRQLAVNLRRIHGLGITKVTVTAVPPVGCLPDITKASSYRTCSQEIDPQVNFHNQLLQEVVTTLNNSTKKSKFVILDLNKAFRSAFKSQGNQPGSLQIEKPLAPCCVGISNEYSCGDVDEQGVKKYTVCERPESAFFWDLYHPSQQGWLAVYSALRDTLDKLSH